MITASRRIQFCAGHRVVGHENKCAHLHGHNYVVFFEAEPAVKVDEIGRVIDFSVLKEILGGWIDEHWDHGMILWEEDEPALEAINVFIHGRDQKLFLLPSNPTAENMAKYLHQVVGPTRLPKTVRLTKVILWETENCYAVSDSR